jgi:hypothetical protein
LSLDEAVFVDDRLLAFRLDISLLGFDAVLFASAGDALCADSNGSIRKPSKSREVESECRGTDCCKHMNRRSATMGNRIRSRKSGQEGFCWHLESRWTEGLCVRKLADMLRCGMVNQKR